MANSKQGGSEKAKRKRTKRRVYFEPTYLREVLGELKDVGEELGRVPSFGKPLSSHDTFGDKRVSYQPEIDETPEERKKNSSRWFKRYWATLTTAQKEAMRRVYIKNPERLSKAEIARHMGIRVDTLQERLDYAIKKLKKHLTEART